MSTEKSLKHLKSIDEFLIANVSNYFEKHSGRDSSSYIQHTFQATWGQYKPVDDFDEVVIRNNVQEIYIHRHQLPTINNLLSVLKTDIISTIHQN